MSTFTIEVRDSEEEKFIEAISNLPYVRFIYNENKEEIIKSIETGFSELNEILDGKSEAFTEEEFFSKL